MVKLFENTFRSVNVALVNEFAIMCRRLGLSVWEVIAAASTKPFGFMAFYPGPGLGGHCLPSDPHYLSWKVRLEGYEPRFITFADEINRRMPGYVVELVTDALNARERAVRGSRILVLGVAYKPNVADTRDSPALEIFDTLLVKGARVEYHDPMVQWVKNLFVFGALIFSQRLFTPSVWPALGAFAIFCGLSGAVYLFNDVADRHKDRLHPDKRHRPIAAGRLAPGAALTAAAVLIAVGLAASVWLSPRF